MTRAAAAVGSGPRRGAVSVRHLAPALGAGLLASCRVLGFARGTGSCRHLHTQGRSLDPVAHRTGRRKHIERQRQRFAFA